MRFSNEEQLKNCIASKKAERLYLLFGNEPVLVSLYRKKLEDMLREQCADADIFDGKALDLPAFYDAAQLMSMFGGRRLIEIADFDVESLSKADCDELCSFFDDLTDDVTVLIIAAHDSIDPKKGKNAKKLLDAVDKNGVVSQLDQRTAGDLRAMLRSRCKKRGCELSNEAAALLTERCGSDMGILINECDKLCAYADGKAITPDMIFSVCPGTISADIFSLARLMLKGDSAAVFTEIDKLIRMRQPVALILSNLGSAFCDLARAAAARAAGKTAADLSSEFAYRFAWRAQNAFRDCARVDSTCLFAVCELLSDTDTALKSTPFDERLMLEGAVMRSMQLLQRGR